MKIRKYLIAVSMIFVLLVAGCAGDAPEETEDTEPEPDFEEIETVLEPEESTTECVTHSDCHDGDECTVNSCVDGECQYIPNYNCESKEYMKPSITEVSFTGEEYVKVEAKNWDVEGWTIENKDGDLFYTFPEKYTLNRYVIIYSKSDLSTSTKKYAGVGNDFWKDSGDTAILVSADGTVISEMSG